MRFPPKPIWLLGWLLVMTSFCAQGDNSAADVGLLKVALSSVPLGNQQSAKSLVVGLEVNAADAGALVAYERNNRLYLPAAELFDAFALDVQYKSDSILLKTPGGDLTAPLKHIFLLRDEIVVSEEFLTDTLNAEVIYAPTDVALQIWLPWSPQVGSAVVTQADGELAVDVKPFPFGLSQLRLNRTEYFADSTSMGQSDLMMSGRLAGGLWQADLQEFGAAGWQARDYWWSRDFERTQILVGHRDVSINDLLPVADLTGAQVLFNSAGITSDPWRDQSRGQYIRRQGLRTRHIEGTSFAGAIAELWVDDQPRGRTRVRLDGTYRFENLRQPLQQFQKIQVKILDPRSLVELDQHDFSQTPTDLLLEAGQRVSFLALGVAGEPLFGREKYEQKASDLAGQALARYGLTDNLTAELGYQLGTNDYVSFGLTAGLSAHWVASYSAASRSENLAQSLDFAGRGDRWYTNLRWADRQASYNDPLSKRTKQVDLRSEYNISRHLAIGLYGRVADNGQEKIDFLLPGVGWRFARRAYARLWPDSQGEYQLNLRAYRQQSDYVDLKLSEATSELEYRRTRGEYVEWFAGVRHFQGQDLVTEVGALWYPRKNDDRSFVRTSVSHQGSTLGFRVNWDTPLWPGVYSSLSVQQDTAHYLVLDDEDFRPDIKPGLQVRWTVSVDLAFAGGRPMAARNNFSAQRFGSLAGRLYSPANSEPLNMAEITQIEVLLNGVPYQAQVQRGRFFLPNIRPGEYIVALGDEHLPIEMSPIRNNVRARIEAAATTAVDFTVDLHYGFMGRVLDAGGGPVANAQLAATDEQGLPQAITRTDANGFYRFVGLKPGRYQVYVSTRQGPIPIPAVIELEDGFQFNQDLKLPETIAVASLSSIDAFSD